MSLLDVERRAQTNIQLYGQLLAAGYRMQDIMGIRDAYVLAAALFAGQLRPEGRPFVCHVVGVASILAMIEAKPATIVAGLLHSAYSHGDFGYGKGQITRDARKRVRAVVGPEIERLVAGYADRRWNAASVADWIANAGRLAGDEREFVVIRLVDTVEDALDLGLQLSDKADNPHRDIPPQRLVDLADAVGLPALGLSLQRVLTDAESALDVSGLREGHAGSRTVCPASWREKALPRLVRFARRVMR
jgi:(p)ppGpp synthase/HD superfamily hydrolase